MNKTIEMRNMEMRFYKTAITEYTGKNPVTYTIWNTSGIAMSFRYFTTTDNIPPHSYIWSENDSAFKNFWTNDAGRYLLGTGNSELESLRNYYLKLDSKHIVPPKFAKKRIDATPTLLVATIVIYFIIVFYGILS